MKSSLPLLGTHGIQELLQSMTELLQYYDLNIFLPLQLPWCQGGTLGVFRVDVSAVIQLLFHNAIQNLDLGVRNVGMSKRP